MWAELGINPQHKWVNRDAAPKMENGSSLMHSNSVDTDSPHGQGHKDKEDMEMDEGNEEEEDDMDSAPLDFTKPGWIQF